MPRKARSSAKLSFSNARKRQITAPPSNHPSLLTSGILGWPTHACILSRAHAAKRTRHRIGSYLRKQLETIFGKTDANEWNCKRSGYCSNFFTFSCAPTLLIYGFNMGSPVLDDHSGHSFGMHDS